MPVGLGFCYAVTMLRETMNMFVRFPLLFKGTSRSGTRRLAAVLAALTVLAGCGTQQSAGEFYDPYEDHNRSIHESNKDIDRAVLRPVSQAYGTTVPEPMRRGVSNFADNLDLPGMVVNDLLQFQLEDAFSNTARFLFNSTIGLAGVFDPATSIGVYERDTDFGETLHAWGLGEGAYVELPLLGPSTERDMVGKVVDLALNPTRLFIPGEIRSAGTAAGVTARIGDRYQYSELIDSLLYDSADSYAQARLLYLQNRRYELNSADEPQYLDPYEDPYADPYAE